MTSRQGGANAGSRSGRTGHTGDDRQQRYDQLHHTHRSHDRRPDRAPRLQPAKRCSGIIHVGGMIAATATGSAFVIGGMLAGATGINAVLLTVAVPLAGLLFAIVLSALEPPRHWDHPTETGQD